MYPFGPDRLPLPNPRKITLEGNGLGVTGTPSSSLPTGYASLLKSPLPQQPEIEQVSSPSCIHTVWTSKFDTFAPSTAGEDWGEEHKKTNFEVH